jgi:hypothetical protein
MSQLLIEIDSPEDEALLLQLLPRLNARVVMESNVPSAKPNSKLVNIAREIAERGEIGKSFGDPSEWQREIRSWDRVLDGRKE